MAKFKQALKKMENPKVLVAVISGTLAILLNTHILSVVNANHIVDYINIVLSLGVTVGIFGNPESHLAPAPVIQEAVANAVQEVAPLVPAKAQPVAQAVAQVANLVEEVAPMLEGENAHPEAPNANPQPQAPAFQVPYFTGGQQK